MARTAKTVSIKFPLPRARPEPAKECAPPTNDFDPCRWPTEISLSFPEASGIELPDAGTLVLRYEVQKSSEDKEKDECSYDLLITEVVSVTEEKPVAAAAEESAEAALAGRFES